VSGFIGRWVLFSRRSSTANNKTIIEKAFFDISLERGILILRVIIEISKTINNVILHNHPIFEKREKKEE